ncbi:MAG TPA: alpha/beta fold hydrolase [Actinoplanes sp.]|jgi:thioesterase domain-containing protein
MRRRIEAPIAGRLRVGNPGRRTGTVVLVHPGALPVSTYAELTAALPTDIDVVLLDLQRSPEYAQAALTGGQPHTSIAELADRCRYELSTVWAGCGPFVLVGWSFGGVIAYAMTERAGSVRQPHHLLLLDSIAPLDDLRCPSLRTRGDAAEEDAMILHWFAMYLAAKRGVRLSISRGEFVGRPVEDGLDLILGRARDAGALYPGTSIDGLRKVYTTFFAGLARNGRLNQTYDARPVHVPMTVVRATEGLVADPGALGWDRLAAAGLDVDVCAGDHYTMLRDPDAVRHLVGLVRRWLPADRFAVRRQAAFDPVHAIPSA